MMAKRVYMAPSSTRASILTAMLLLLIAASACGREPQGAQPPVTTGEVIRKIERIQTGPPAPAPDAVAILRPAPAEQMAVNAALQRLIDEDRSPARPLLKKFESLVLLPQPRPNIAATFTPTTHRLARHDAFVETARRGNIDLLLHGDSITDWWQLDANKPVFDRYFGHLRTANFAVAGDMTHGVLWGLRNGEGQGFQPRAVMLLVGINNIGAFTAPEIAEGIGAVVLELRTNFPAAKILLLGLFPYSVAGDPIRGKIAEVNRIISQLDDSQHVFYMDVGPRFLDDAGEFLPGVFLPDNLHPQARGYEMWGDAVSPTLAELLR
jgi:lysophospholipase L1-like esterase